MKRPSRRQERVAELLRQATAAFLHTEANEDIGFVTVTRVEVSRDLTHAEVWLSVLGDEAEKTQRIESVRRLRGRLRAHFGRTVRLRQVPDVRFHLDRGIEHARRIDQLLSEITRDEDAP